MNRYPIFILIFPFLICAQTSKTDFKNNHLKPLATNNPSREKISLKFIENKGQVSDQHYKLRSDVLFYGSTAEFNFHIGKDGISFIKKNSGYVDNILFLKWDRFSRNVAEAYITIRDLKKMGVEPQSIEQPLDFEIPESKIMLAIYLAAPEVDNDRRALNIFHGIRRGKKEGRWLGACLKGYINTRDENNRPIIAPEGGKKEELIKRAFGDFITGVYNIEELRRKLNKEGLDCTRNSFWMLLRNKGYIGKVLVPAYKDEHAHWVDGIHEALVDEKTFYAVQDILDGRKKNLPNKFQTVRDEFPLRGYLTCPQCNRNLTASASRGRAGGKFFYYHCGNGCKERQKASTMHDKIVPYLAKKCQSNIQATKLFATILKQQLKQNNTSGKKEIEGISKSIGKLKLRLKNAKDLMLDGEFSASEYKDMKYEIETELDKLNRDEIQYREGLENYDEKIDDCLELLLNLDKYYETKNTEIKQKIIGSVFPEKLVFENNEYRTTKLNDVVVLICPTDKGFGKKKGGKKSDFSESSLRVDPERFELSSK
ncbi:MAG: recombinase family protein [Bacteroidetes bacterium]|nr:recombinase family protein [Bacteroidota bacterium]